MSVYLPSEVNIKPVYCHLKSRLYKQNFSFSVELSTYKEAKFSAVKMIFFVRKVKMRII